MKMKMKIHAGGVMSGRRLYLEDMESTEAHMGGMIVRHNSLNVSNYRSAMSLPEYCEQQNVVGISDVDTRAITRRLRDTGGAPTVRPYDRPTRTPHTRACAYYST